MAINTIPYFEAMKLIESGQPFYVSYVTLDKSRKEGGKIVTMKGVICTSKYVQEDLVNISNPQSGQPRHFRSRLMTHFNGKEVIW